MNSQVKHCAAYFIGILSVIIIYIIVFLDIWYISDTGSKYCANYSNLQLFALILLSQIICYLLSLIFSIADLVNDILGILSFYRVDGHNKVNWIEMLYAFQLSIISSILTISVTFFVVLPFIKYRGCSSIWDTELSYKVCLYPLMYPVQDLFFYMFHKIAHVIPLLYKKIHNTHHLFKNVHAITAFACHPLEHVFINLLTVFLPLFIFNLQIELCYIFVIHALINTIVSHSGYHFNYCCTSKIHSMHHTNQNVNYGALFTDKLFNSYGSY